MSCKSIPLGETNKVIIKYDGAEYRVPGPDGREATAYYTEWEDDAIGTAKLMYKNKDIEIEIKRVKELPDKPLDGLSGTTKKAIMSNGCTLELVDGYFYYYIPNVIANRVDDNTKLFPESLNNELHMTMSELREEMKRG